MTSTTIFRATFVSFVILFCFPRTHAQDVEVSATVDAETVPVNGQLQLTIAVSGANSGDADHPRLSRLKGFDIAGPPSISTQFQWINGKSNSSRAFVYTLLPEKEGQVTIDPIEVPVGRKIFRTQPILVRVTAASGRSAAPRRRRLDPFGDETLGGNHRAGRIGEEVSVAAELDRASVYPGQQVTLSYHLHTSVGVTGLQLQESPPLTGFWIEDLAVDPRPDGTRKIIDGREYIDYVVKKQALFPNTAGKLKILPATFAISVKTPGDFFGLFGQAETVYRKTREVSLEVKPFPTAGRPGSFNEAVGSFNLTSNLDKTEAATGEAVALRVKLSGRGNLKMIPDIALPALPDFTVYSSKQTENVRPFEGDLIGGDKIWEYVIVPKAPGQQTIPSVTFSYFDPHLERYETLTTPPLILKVIRGSDPGGPVTGLSGITKQNLMRQGADINFIKLSASDLDTKRGPIYKTTWFYVVAGLALCFNAGAFLYGRERARESGNVALARSRQARRNALARLKRGEKAAKLEPRRFYDEAAGALSGFLTDKLNLPEIALTGDTLERTLIDHSIDLQKVRETMACLQECDFGRFVSAAGAEKTRELAGRIRKVIDSLERDLV